MNDAYQHIIAKDDDVVVGYALTMLHEVKDEIPALSAMFDTAEDLLGAKNYLTMGQICVSKQYRKKGVFREMYDFYKRELKDEFDCLITEVATKNVRSLSAHLNVGFIVIKTQVTNGAIWETLCRD